MSIFAFDFMVKALIACIAVGAAAPLVGAFIVQRGQALVGDGMGHMAFAGVGLAFLLGVEPLVGALALTVLAAAVLVRLTRSGLGGDLALALIFYGGIAVGFLFAARSGNAGAAVLGLLFGSPFDRTWGETAAIVVLAALVASTVTALYRPLVALAFDEAAARVAGVPAERLVFALTLVVALIVVGGMYAIGLLLVSAMMVVPVAAAAQLASSYRATLAIASAVGALSAVAGLMISFYADLAPGASIVLAALCCYGAASGVRLMRAPADGR